MAKSPERRWPLTNEIVRTTVLVTAVVAAFAAGFLVVWLASAGIVIIAVGILLGVLFNAGARGLAHVVPWRRQFRLIIVFLLAAILIMAAIWWGGTILINQASNFFSAMKNMLQQANDFIQSGALGTSMRGMNLADLLPNASFLFGGAETVASLGLHVIVMAAAILFLGAFFAWEPESYKAIVLSLLPQEKRPRVHDVLDSAGHAMHEWMIGQSISMTVIFCFSLFALMLVGMPYPVLLAVQAGLLTFIPTIGPFIAGVIIILAGLSQSFTMALYGLVTYVLIQFLETHLVTPLVQERTVRLPPAATLGLQVIAAFLFGLLGVAFAVPLAAAARVIIEELYVKDYLGGPWEVEGGRPWLHSLIDRVLGKFRSLR